MAGGMKPLLAIALALGAAPALAADPLPDPTRPPSGWLSGDPSADAAAGGRRVQTVILPKRGKPVAVIGGQQVALGEKYGDATVVRITENEVVLESAAGRETLKVNLDAEKTPSVAVGKRNRAR